MRQPDHIQIQRLQRAVEELVILKEIANYTTSVLSLDRVIEMISQKCMAYLKVEQIVVMLFDREEEQSFRTLFRQYNTGTDKMPF